jgi:tRNA(Ile)-lysidine synthase
VALGHTRDDQAETVLLRLMRGAGLDGLAGIPPVRGRFVRPLLDLGRDELRAFLVARGQPWVEDLTNADISVPRNYVRTTVLPALEAHAPRLAEALSRQAEIARDETAWVSGLVNQVLPRFVQPVQDGTRVEGALAAEPLGLQRRVLLAALRQAGVRQPGLDEVETVRGLLSGGPLAADLPGRVRANRIGAGVVLTVGAVRYVGQPCAFRYALPVPGEVGVAEVGVTVTAGVSDGSAAPSSPSDLWVEVSEEVTAGGLFVRNWRPGDRIRPAGLGGRKKLQDVFVDRKVPRARRGRLPLVVDADDRVLWVPGLVVDERAVVTNRTKAVVVLKLTEPVGGPE